MGGATTTYPEVHNRRESLPAVGRKGSGHLEFYWHQSQHRLNKEVYVCDTIIFNQILNEELTFSSSWQW